MTDADPGTDRKIKTVLQIDTPATQGIKVVGWVDADGVTISVSPADDESADTAV